MEKFQPGNAREFRSHVPPPIENLVLSDDEQNEQWKDLQQFATKEIAPEDDILSDAELAAAPEEQILLSFRAAATRGLKNLERIQSIGGIDKYLDAPEEVWQGKRDSMDAQSSERIKELGGVMGWMKRRNDENRQKVWVTANEIRKAIEIVDTYREKKRALSERKK